MKLEPQEQARGVRAVAKGSSTWTGRLRRRDCTKVRNMYFHGDSRERAGLDEADRGSTRSPGMACVIDRRSCMHVRCPARSAGGGAGMF